MGLVISTGTFRFIPPNPSIGGLSSSTGHANDTIRVFGNDLDYIDTITLAGQNCNFNLIDLNNIDITIPSDPESGYLVASSEEFTVTGNTIPFYPIPKIEQFSPNNSASGELITINGKSLTTATSVYLKAQEMIDDIEYMFSGDNNSFIITNPNSSGTSQVVLTQNINILAEDNQYKIKNILPFTFSSGKRIDIEYGSLSQKYYENHIFTFSGLNTSGFIAFTSGLNTGNKSYLINFTPSLSSTNYSVFYSTALTGQNYYSYISGKTNSSFYINFDRVTENYINTNFVILPRGQFTFDTGQYIVSGINISSGISSTGINFVNEKLYSPFLLTSYEYSGAGTGYIYNISNFNKNSFNVNTPYNTNYSNLTLNYCRIINPNSDLNIFNCFGKTGFYKKIYLYTGDANSSLTEIPANNFQIINKNQATFEVPYTDYYINGPIKLYGPLNIQSQSNENFFETPLPTGVFPPFGIRGQNLIISGKSFKKPILNDGTGDYNYITVKFRYADNVYRQNQNTFQSDFILLNVNTLSGIIPIENFPSGRYAIQMIAENGSLYE